MAKSKKVGAEEVQVDRRRDDRRNEDSPTVDSAVETAEAPAVETSDNSETPKPRRKQQRRRQIDPTTCERDYNDEELRFMRALDDYKRVSGRMFPTCSEILEVVRGMGYIKLTDEEQQLLDSVREVEEEMAEATDSPEAGEEAELDALESEAEVL